MLERVRGHGSYYSDSGSTGFEATWACQGRRKASADIPQITTKLDR